MTVNAYLRIFRRWWWMLLLGAALGAAAGYVIQVRLGSLSSGSLRSYAATATVSVGAEVEGLEQSGSDLNLAESLVPTYVELAQRPPVTERVVESLQLPMSAGRLAFVHLEVTQPDRTHLIEITGKHPNPQTAAAIASEAALQLQAFAPVRPLGLVQIVSLAEVPNSAGFEPYLTLGLVSLAGLLLAAGLALLIEFALDRPYTAKWAATRLEVPVLGTYSSYPGSNSGKSSSFGDAYLDPVWWSVMATLERAMQESHEGAGSLLVVGTGSKGSKTQPAIALGVASAASGRNTILIDADIRRSRGEPPSEIQGDPGLSSLSANGQNATQMLIPGQVDSLQVLPAGRIQTEGSPRFPDAFWKTFLDDLRGQSDLIVMRGPILGTGPEGMGLALAADGVLLNMELGKTRAPDINDLADILNRSGATVLGVVAYRK